MKRRIRHRERPSVFIDLIGEEWRAIPSMTGYEVSDAGRVRSWRAGSQKRLVPRLRKPVVIWSGYETIVYPDRVLGRHVCRFVHHLVLEAFVGPKVGNMECRHLDSDPLNNRLTNLAWGTHSENVGDQIARGTDTRGERNGNASLSKVQAEAIRQRLSAGERGVVLADEFSVSQATICRIKKGLRYVA